MAIKSSLVDESMVARRHPHEHPPGRFFLSGNQLRFRYLTLLFESKFAMNDREFLFMVMFCCRNSLAQVTVKSPVALQNGRLSVHLIT